jgi:hypothetical protein
MVIDSLLASGNLDQPDKSVASANTAAGVGGRRPVLLDIVLV